MKKLLISACLATALFGENSFEDEFLSTLETINESVEEQKINADHTASTVSVLRHDDLLQLGIHTLHDALTLIPGVEANVNHVGWKEVTIRGVRNANTYGFDKVKLLIDGVSVTSFLYGSVHYYLDFPIDLIERIEILRGPASALYGSGAYSGAINVVTKLSATKTDNHLFAYADSYTHKEAGGSIGYEDGKLVLGADAYYQAGDKTIDSKRSGRAFDRDAESFERLKDYAIGVKAEYGDLSWVSRLKKSDMGNYFGTEEYAESDDDRGQRNSFVFSELRYTPDLGLSLQPELKLGYNQYDFYLSGRAFPQALVSASFVDTVSSILQSAPYNMDSTTADATAQAYADAGITGDQIYGYASKEESRYGSIGFTLPLEHHTIRAEYLNKETRNISNKIHFNYSDALILADLADTVQDEDWNAIQHTGFIGDDIDRILHAYTLSDQIQYEHFDIALAVRQDNYNHIEPVTSSNLGLIYRLDDHSNIKLAHGQAFRVPSWIEFNTLAVVGLEGNKDLKPEQIDTTELFWTHIPGPDHRVRFGGFFSTMRDVIDIAPEKIDIAPEYQYLVTREHTYLNYKKRESKGVELEYEGKLDIKNRGSFNLSYVKTMAYGIQPFFNDQDPDEAKDVPIPDTAELLANAIYIHSFSKSFSLASRLYYIGQKVQNASGETLDDFTDLTETLHYYLSPDWQLSFSLKNALNDRHVVPSNWAFHDGLPREERYISIRLHGEF